MASDLSDVARVTVDETDGIVCFEQDDGTSMVGEAQGCAIANGTPTNNHRAPDCIDTAVQRRQRGRMISGFEWVGLKLRVHDFLLRTYTSVTVLALLLLNAFLIFRRARSARWRQPIANISDA